MKNKNLFESIKHALNGIKLAFKSEKNLKKYIVIAIIFGVLNILTKSTYIDAIFYIILCFIVFAFEYINTAIERVVDKFILKIDENAKYIKDVSASGVFEKLSEEVSPQGILAVVEMPACTPEPPRSLSLLLDGVSDPGNMGTVLRTANAAGYEDIYLRGCTDPFASKCVRASMGGLFRVRLHIGGDAELASALAGIPLICADMGGKNAFCFSPPERFCLVIGNEANGVTEQMRAACAHTVRVPMRPGCESLNAGVSAGILMYLLRADHFRSV